MPDFLDKLRAAVETDQAIERAQSGAQLVRTGALDCQVCVPAEWSDAQVKAFADAENPCGTELGWGIRRAGHRLLEGAQERVGCAARGGFVHVMLDA